MMRSSLCAGLQLGMNNSIFMTSPHEKKGDTFTCCCRQVDGLIGSQEHEPSAIRQCDASSERPVRGLVKASIRPVERFLKVNVLPILGSSCNILGTPRGHFAPEAKRKVAMGTM